MLRRWKSKNRVISPNRSDERLTLETSTFKLFTVVNLRYQLSRWYQITLFIWNVFKCPSLSCWYLYDFFTNYARNRLNKFPDVIELLVPRSVGGGKEERERGKFSVYLPLRLFHHHWSLLGSLWFGSTHLLKVQNPHAPQEFLWSSPK